MKSCKSMKGAIQQRTGPKGGKQWRCGNGPWKYGAPPSHGKEEKGVAENKSRSDPRLADGYRPKHWEKGSALTSKFTTDRPLHGMPLDEHHAWFHKMVGLPKPTRSVNKDSRMPRYELRDGGDFIMPLFSKQGQADAEKRGDYRDMKGRIMLRAPHPEDAKRK